MSASPRYFSGTGTATAAYAAVPLLWAMTGQTNLFFKADFNGGTIGGLVRNTHVSVTLKVKIVASNGVGSDSSPVNSDPTTWPVVLAEQTIAAATDALFEIDYAHHQWYAVLILDGSGHATCAVYGTHKSRA